VTITIHNDLIQGSEEWHAARCGMLTASEFKLLLTPALKIADNDKVRAHLWEIAAQRITGYTEPSYIGDDMLRGHEDEILARELYGKTYAPVIETGFITNDRWGFVLGCSPDGLVGDDGMIECKSRRQKFQIQTIVEHYRNGAAPSDYLLQVQGEMLVAERKWCDLISYSGGLPMATMRLEADPDIQGAIEEACERSEMLIAEIYHDFHKALSAQGGRLIPTERRIEMEIF